MAKTLRDTNVGYSLREDRVVDALEFDIAAGRYMRLCNRIYREVKNLFGADAPQEIILAETRARLARNPAVAQAFQVASAAEKRIKAIDLQLEVLCP